MGLILSKFNGGPAFTKTLAVFLAALERLCQREVSLLGGGGLGKVDLPLCH
jgi:hypothetical protein